MQLNLSGFASDTSIDARLLASQLTIDRVLGNPQLQALLDTHGYPAEVMLKGRALRDQALALHHQQRASYRAKLAATAALNMAQRQATSVFARHVATARVALQDDPTVARALAMDIPRQRNRASKLMQAQHFYTNLLIDPALVARMTVYGVDEKQLIKAQDAVKQVEAGLVTQQDTRATALAATQARNDAMDALNRWMQNFLAMARVALAGST